MKTVCIYHSIDLDGWMSAAIVNLKNEKTRFCSVCELSLPETWAGSTPCCGGITTLNIIDFIGYNYGQPIPDLSEYDKVIMCDISFPKEEMEKLYEKLNNNFIWIDHHISAINDSYTGNYNRIEGIRDIKYTTCELTWKYFFPNDSMPELVRRLGRYDCFGHIGTDEEQMIIEFQYGARMVISNYEQAYDFLISNINCGNSVCESIHIDGAAIYRYLCTEAKQTYKNGFEIVFDEPYLLTPNGFPLETSFRKRFICINKERFNPINFGIDYHKDGYEGCACFYYANGMWNFSIYNDNGLVDCSVIAKQYGGGGHKGAAGFILNNANFNNLIFNSTLINYCIEVRRGGIGEEDCVLHPKFSSPPTKEDIEAYLISEDIGYDPKYCSYDFYQI